MAKSSRLPVDLTQFLRNKGSPLADHVGSIIEASNRHRVDPRLLVAIAGGETSFGKAGRGPRVHNAWGIGPGRSYGSWAEGIDAAAKLLRSGYLDKGLTSLAAIQQKWAPVGASNDPTNLNSNWIRTNSAFYSALGGNPSDVTKGWRAGSSPRAFAPAPRQQRLTTPEVPQLDFDPVGAQALENLSAIARGEKATAGLSALLDATVERTKALAAAQYTIDQKPIQARQADVSPDGGSYSPTRTHETSTSKGVQRAVDIALAQVGKPYVWGSVGPKSFDCSGLIEYAFEQAGIKTPGRLTTWTMAKLGSKVRGSMQPGDWVITNKGRHVVMYIGGGEVVAAPHSGTNVQVQKLSRFKGDIVDIRRFPAPAAQT